MSKTNPARTGIRILTDVEMERLDWRGPFQYPNLVRIRVPPDGSCFFHAIAKSYFEPYILGRWSNGKPVDRRKFIATLRKDLSVKLGSKIDPSDSNSTTYYDTLSRGRLADFSQSVPQYSLDSMMKELNSNRSVDNVYNEFISDQLNRDIYILDAVKRDVYMTGHDDDILYKNRKSIVILYLPGHYELVGVYEKGVTKTIFDPSHDLIRAIRQRINNIRRGEQ